MPSRHHTRTSGPRVHRRRRQHRHHSQRRRHRPKYKERNFMAAIISMIVTVILCTALAEPAWFFVRGGGCRQKKDTYLLNMTIGVYEFFCVGHFEEYNAISEGLRTSNGMPEIATHYIYKQSSVSCPGDTLIDCVNPKGVQVMQCIIALVFIAILFTMTSFLLDLIGPTRRSLKFIRRHAFGNVAAVLVCVTINGFCFWEAELIEALQEQTKHHQGSRVEVKFDVSFYLITAAGALSVIASACNLLKRYPTHETSHREPRLLDDYDGLDMLMPPIGIDGTVPQTQLPPPPPYVP